MPFSFRSPASGSYAAKKKKSLTSSTNVPLVRLNIISIFLSRWRSEGVITGSGMKSPLRASCSDKRVILVPVQPSVSQARIHSLQALPYCRGKIPGQLPARGLGADRCLFNFCNPYFFAAVPAFHPNIGIPALIRDAGLCPDSFYSLHHFPPTFGAVDWMLTVPQIIFISLLLASAQN